MGPLSALRIATKADVRVATVGQRTKAACAYMLKKMRYWKPEESESVELRCIVTRQRKRKRFCPDVLLSGAADVHVLHVP